MFSHTGSTDCKANYHKCPTSDKCIPICDFCDGEDDCGDWSDEVFDFCGAFVA